METSDHWPCSIEISTEIPAAKIFRCENFWLQHDNFKNIVQQAWTAPTQPQEPARRLTAKFKKLKSVLRTWSANISSLSLLIKHVKSLIYLFETMELLRDLSIQEWNFRNILDDRLVSLLRMQKAYWKQRSKVAWVREGDAGTKLFHAHATVRHRRNTIASLLDDNNIPITEHNQKAELIWDAFKQRLGISEFMGMDFDLEDLLTFHLDLSTLEDDFGAKEINSIILELLTDKSPGPDGFNNEFIKKCWSFIAQDF
ncbi:uncharacterized protein [Miscanthus floridulus]|uniref:uncharacterized protein n=1 Tax=Miscanthus floridulus TaxID=154761 RepID=UPI0034596BDC